MVEYQKYDDLKEQQYYAEMAGAAKSISETNNTQTNASCMSTRLPERFHLFQNFEIFKTQLFI